MRGEGEGEREWESGKGERECESARAERLLGLHHRPCWRGGRRAPARPAPSIRVVGGATPGGATPRNAPQVVVSQDRIAENRTYAFVNSKATSYSHIAEIRSVQEARFGVPKTTTLKLTSKANQVRRKARFAGIACSGLLLPPRTTSARATPFDSPLCVVCGTPRTVVRAVHPRRHAPRAPRPAAVRAVPRAGRRERPRHPAAHRARRRRGRHGADRARAGRLHRRGERRAHVRAGDRVHLPLHARAVGAPAAAAHEPGGRRGRGGGRRRGGGGRGGQPARRDAALGAAQGLPAARRPGPGQEGAVPGLHGPQAAALLPGPAALRRPRLVHQQAARDARRAAGQPVPPALRQGAARHRARPGSGIPWDRHGARVTGNQPSRSGHLPGACPALWLGSADSRFQNTRHPSPQRSPVSAR